LTAREKMIKRSRGTRLVKSFEIAKGEGSHDRPGNAVWRITRGAKEKKKRSIRKKAMNLGEGGRMVSPLSVSRSGEEDI